MPPSLHQHQHTPTNRLTSSAVATSQIFTSPLFDALTTRLPSGWNATEFTLLKHPSKVHTCHNALL